MKLNYIYHRKFTRTRVDEKYFQKHKNLTVLGEKFIGKYYIVVYQIEKNGVITYHVLVENIKKPKLINLIQVSNDDNYIVFQKHNLCRQLRNVKMYNCLANNGLYQNSDAGIISKNNIFSIHRLVFCLYLDIKNREVHHITKDIETRNDISALIRVFRHSHDILNRKSLEISVPMSLRIQNRHKRKIFKHPRNTLTQNDALLEEFLKSEVA